MKKIVLSFSILFGMIYQISSAQIGIGTTSPHKSAILDIESTTKGFLPPRVANHSSISNPAEGLVIYDETDDCLNIFNGGSWVDLCASNSGTPPSNNQNSTMASDCEGAFDISNFGYLSYWHYNSNHYFYQMHLNADGSKIYSNDKHYYDTNSIAYSTTGNGGEIARTSQIVAVEQIFPNKKWKTFISMDNPYNHHPEILFLLAKDGELCSTSLVEVISTTASNNYRIGVSTSLIDPTDDNKYQTYIGNNNNDFRFQPYKHYVDDDINSTIKFSSLFIYDEDDEIQTFIPYDNIGKKFYSLGLKTISPSRAKYKLSAIQLFRSNAPTTLKESIVLKEADVINKVIAHFNTEFEEGDGVNKTFIGFHYVNKTVAAFITKDGYLNAIVNDNVVVRYEPPAGTKIVSITGSDHWISTVLCDDGKVYDLGTASLYDNGGYTTAYNVPITGLGNVTLNTTSQADIKLLFHDSRINALDLKRAYYNNTSNGFNVLATDGKLYSVSNQNPAQFDDYHSDYEIPLVDDIIAGEGDMIVRGVNGICFGVHNQNSGVRLPETMTGNQPIGLDGFPLKSPYPNDRTLTHRGRLLYSCFGK